MRKKALVTGVRGQDGAYLSQLLLEKGYEVIGTDRRRVDQDNWRFKYLGIEDDVQIRYMDLLDEGNINRTIKEEQPDEIYNLAAQSFVAASFDQPTLTSNVDAMGVLRLLEAVRTFAPEARFYQASTSEMFGKVVETPQKESTPFYPRSPYGVAKLFAHWMVKNYREAFNIYGCSGILFNHESPLRGLEFVTRKITHHVAQMNYGKTDPLVLGNMDASRDWGYAKEYVEGIWRMLQQDTPDDYVLSTGETHTVRNFVEWSFEIIGKEVVWEGEGSDEKGYDTKSGDVIVRISEQFYRPAEVNTLLGDPTRANDELGWKATTKAFELTKVMMESDLALVKG